MTTEPSTPRSDDELPWEWERRAGSHAELARFVSAAAIRDLHLVAGRGLREPDIVVAERLYNLLRERQIAYAPEPQLPKAGKQAVRDPWLLLRNGVGTCIDFAAAYAAMCLEVATCPLLAVTQRHAFVLIANGRMLGEAHPSAPLELDGFQRADGEAVGVLSASDGAFAAALTRGELFAVDCSLAHRDGGDFAAAQLAGTRQAMQQQPLIVDVLYLQHQLGLEPLRPPAGHRPIHRYIPADEDQFVPYPSHAGVVEQLEGATGVVVLLGRQGQGKSRIGREIARRESLGGGWFLDASGPQTLINSLSAADLAGRGERPGGRARVDREGYAQNARALLSESDAPWTVVLDNANGDPGQIEHLLPTPEDGQLLLITTINDEWAQMPDVTPILLPRIGAEEMLDLRGAEDPDMTELIELIDGLPLLLEAFRGLMQGTGWDAAKLARHAPTEGGPSLRGQRTLWRAIQSAGGFDVHTLHAAGHGAYLPPDHQPLAAFHALDPNHGETSARYLAEHGLLAYELQLAGEERSLLRLHRTFGEAVRSDLEQREPSLCDELVQEIAAETALRDLLDVHGDLDTVVRLADRLEALDESNENANVELGLALHGIAWLLELHGQTRPSGDMFARAEAHLEDGAHQIQVADCRHGRARTINQHHAKDESLLREAVAWAQSARLIFKEQGLDGDHCLAMEGLLRQKLASFPGPGETEHGLLLEALRIIEEADNLRNRPGSAIEPAELARSHFNLAGIRIRLAQSRPADAQTHLDKANAVYAEVHERRIKIYRRPVHPHIAACIVGYAYVEYSRALFIPATHRQRTSWLRAATEHATEALEQRSTLEGSVDLEEVEKVAGFLTKVLLARLSAPVAAASRHASTYEKAMDELARAGIALPRVPALPSAREKIPAAIAAWVDSPALRVLLAEFGATLPPEQSLADTLAWLEEFSTRWDFREGKERNLVNAPRFTPVNRRVIVAAAEALGLTGSEKAKDSSAEAAYDHVLILGGLVRACLARPLYTTRLIDDGSVRAAAVTALGGFRAIAGDELGMLESITGESVDDEFHAMDAGVRNAFHTTALIEDRGEDSDVLGASWRVRKYATDSALSVEVVAAPSREPGTRRANTPDTYAWFATELAKLEPGQRVLVVTTAIYVPYQHAKALQMLALPYGVEVDTIGVDDPGSLHPGLRQESKPHNYLQEIRSTISALRALNGASHCDS
ncbi:MAG TPA: hypothetical protein VIJ50_05820 [Solirubrobacteraceae bacterium]